MSLKEKAEAYESEHAAWYRDQIADYDLRMVAASDIQLLHNPIHTAQKEPKIGKALQARVLEARQSVAVQSPYITANPAFIDTLGQAAQNAEVHILTNSTDSTPNCLAYSDYDANRQAFIDTGATLYEYHSLGSIHGKSAVIDGRISAVGSLNLDDRSMYIDTESVLLIESPAFAQSLTDAMEALQYKSIPSTFSGGGMKVPTTKQKCLNMLSKIAGPLRFLI